MPTGLLIIDKPSGQTSRRAVDQVARLVRGTKVGHAGTLDPLASGVLVLALGTATRLIEYVQRMPKRYTGTFLLGRTSPTEDIEGPVTMLDGPSPTEQELITAAAGFVGKIQQRPPAFSALKVGGRRAYNLARAGAVVELAEREVEIHSLSISRYAYPELTLEIECGGGTYVRSLGRDLARSLDTDAVMSALTRTAIGDFRIADAVAPEQLTAENLPNRLLSPMTALSGMPIRKLTPEAADRVARGQSIEAAGIAPCGEWAAIDPLGRLIAILQPRGHNQLGPNRSFPEENG